MFFEILYKEGRPTGSVTLDRGMNIVAPIERIIFVVAMKYIERFDLPFFANSFKVTVHVVFVCCLISPAAPDGARVEYDFYGGALFFCICDNVLDRARNRGGVKVG